MGDTPWMRAVYPGDTEAYGVKNISCLVLETGLSVVCAIFYSDFYPQF